MLEQSQVYRPADDVKDIFLHDRGRDLLWRSSGLIHLFWFVGSDGWVAQLATQVQAQSKGEVNQQQKDENTPQPDLEKKSVQADN